MEDLDVIDRKLLKILANDSSHTIKELAKKVNLSPSPVLQRVKKLESSGYIKKYIAVLNPEKFNQGFLVFCNIKLKQHDKTIG
ncbi:MAG: Lrp/AsnC family transcriptional regulator, partial [Flavitalea sp.]